MIKKPFEFVVNTAPKCNFLLNVIEVINYKPLNWLKGLFLEIKIRINNHFSYPKKYEEIKLDIVRKQIIILIQGL